MQLPRIPHSFGNLAFGLIWLAASFVCAVGSSKNWLDVQPWFIGVSFVSLIISVIFIGCFMTDFI